MKRHGLEGLNPCFNGRWSLTMARLDKKTKAELS